MSETNWPEGVDDAHKRRVLLQRLERDEGELAEAIAAYEKASEKSKPYVQRQAQARNAEWRARGRLEDTRRELAALLSPADHGDGSGAGGREGGEGA